MDFVESYKEAAIKAFQKIDFANRYLKISNKYDVDDFDLLLKKIDNKKTLEIFRKRGYTAKRASPGKDFYVEEFYGDVRFNTTFVLTRGMTTIYLGVYFRGESLNTEVNLAFLYRYLIGDKNAQITAPCFRNYEELEGVVSETMVVYEDFKNEFLESIPGDSGRG